MTEVEKLVARLKQTWAKTNHLNYDAMESALKSAKKKIDGGEIDADLIDTYLTISDAFEMEFGGNYEKKR